MSHGKKMSQKLPILNIKYDLNTLWSPGILKDPKS